MVMILRQPITTFGLSGSGVATKTKKQEKSHG